MQLLPIKRHVKVPNTAGTLYRRNIYVYSGGRDEINCVPSGDVDNFRKAYFDNPEYYIQ